MDGVAVPSQRKQARHRLMAEIRRYCDEKALKGKQRAEYIREYKRLALIKYGIQL